MYRLLASSLLLTTLFACSSTQKDGSHYAQYHAHRRGPASVQCTQSSSCSPFDKYREALENTKNKQSSTACGSFRDLAGQKDFALATYAKVRAFATCLDKDEQGNAIDLGSVDDFLKIKVPSWMDDQVLRAALLHTQNLHDELGELKISTLLLAKPAYPNATEGEKIALRALQILKAHAKDANFAKAATLDQLHGYLYDISPSRNPNPKDEKWQAVAKDFSRKLDFVSARKWYQKIASHDPDPEKQYLALDAIRFTYKLERSNNHTKLFSAARKELKFAQKNLQKKGRESIWPAYYVKSATTLAGHLWTFASIDGSVDKAIKTLDDATRQMNKLKTTYPIDDLQWMEARIYDERGKSDVSLKLLQNIGKDIKDEDRRDQMLWTKAFLLYKIGHLTEAAAAFADMIPMDPREHNSRAHFWRAKSLKIVNKDMDPTTFPDFKWLLENDSFSYYGLLTYRELGMPLPSIDNLRQEQSKKRKVASEKGSFSPFGNKDDAELAGAFLQAKEVEYLRKFLDATYAKIGGDPNSLALIDLLKLYAQAEQYKPLFDRIPKLPPDLRSTVFVDDPELVFPTEPFTKQVKDIAGDQGVRWELVYSIMRQESGLDPQARSPANAFGLLQLIPENAIKIADQAGVKLETKDGPGHHVQMENPEDLFDPDVNIPLGIALMKSLLKANKDNFVKTTASYNANSLAVDRWVHERFHGDMVSFIDDIPYEETRTYVKTVMRNFVFYTRLQTPSKEVQFPEWCLAAF